MASTEELAVLALRAYGTPKAVSGTDTEFNRPALPDGWQEQEWHTDDGWGFSYGIYTNGAQVVVSYAGTNEIVDWATNLPAAFGLSGFQTKSAAMALIRAQAYGQDITLTGHSLGGGLASVMATWFNRPAVVFDEAPFEATARNVYVLAYTKAALDLAGYTDRSFSVYDALAEFPSREQRVDDYYVTEEALQVSRLFLPAVLGTDHPVEFGVSKMLEGSRRIDLHSQSLLTAGLLSDDFRGASTVVQEMLPVLMDSGMYNTNTTARAENILIKFIRSEQDTPGDGDITHFASDVKKLANLSEVLQRALVAQTLDWYAAKPEGDGSEFLTQSDGAIQFTRAAAAFTSGADKAAKYVDPWLKPIVEHTGLTYAPSLAEAEQWTVAIADTGASASALDSSKTQLFIGGDNGDKFTAGNGNDTLFGGAGDDTLIGGSGSDQLFGGGNDDDMQGGPGYDEYRVEGHDTITDTDGSGFIETKDGLRIAGVIEKHDDGTFSFLGNASTSVTGDDTHLTLTLANGDSVTINDFKSGELGLELTKPAPHVDQDRTIYGDLVPLNGTFSTTNAQAPKDDLGNVITDPNRPQPDRSDYIYDSTGNDHIESKGGNDYIDAFRGGNDYLDGGSGDDFVLGRAGDDTVIGGTGSDILRGDAGNDQVFAGASQISIDDAVAVQDAAPSGLKGDFIDGGADNDTIVGDTGNDALNGGPGSDIIFGGAGNDDIDGDLETTSVAYLWSTTRTVNTLADGSKSYLTTYNGVSYVAPTSGGDDYIYGGGGDDWVRAGFGNDYVDGGAGNDVLFGDAGNDQIFGDAGNDVLAGDSSTASIDLQGDDYLDGEDGNDSLFGFGGSDHLFGGSGDDLLVADNPDGSDAGTDYLDGEDGNDTLLGGASDDTLIGGAGDDRLQGDSGTGKGDGNDSIDGGDGNDLIFGEGGKDTIDGGAGNDRIAGDHGGTDASGEADVIFGGAGNDTIQGQGGDDSIDGGAGDDLILGDDGNDTIAGGDGNDQLQGGSGDDVIDGGPGVNTMFGGDGNDTITGGADTDFIIGGPGNDLLQGGDGDDVYYYASGDGQDTISDSGGTDWLVFSDINVGQVSLGVGSLKLVLPDGGSVDIANFDRDNPFAPGGVEYFQFADGTVMDKVTLIQTLNFTPTGTPNADVLSGTALSDTMHGLAADDVLDGRAGNDSMYGDAGDDELHGGDGNDFLSGGEGNDLLIGDAGNDTLQGDAGNDFLAGGSGNDLLLGGDGDDAYFFDIGDGQDTVVDTSGTNQIVLGAGLNLSAVTFGRSGSDLTIKVTGTSDQLTVKDWFSAGSTFAHVVLGDGTQLDHASVDANMPSNLAPVTQPDGASLVEDVSITASGNVLVNDSDPEGHTLRVTNPGNYSTSYGTLSINNDGSYSYSLANASPQVQSLAAGDAVSDTFIYTTTDDDPAAPATAQGTVTFTIHGTNDAPVVVSDSASASEDGSSISGNVLANDHDVDAGTTLSVASPGVGTGGLGTLTLRNDGGWSYSVLNGSQAVESLGAGQSVTDSFTFNVTDGITEVAETLNITVVGQDDAPVVAQALADQSTSANTRWIWKVPAGSFADADYGDSLAYSASLADDTAMPAWLSFDAITQTFSGRAPRGTTLPLNLKVTVHDRSGLSASDDFTLTFTNSKGGPGGGGSNGGSHGNEGVGNGSGSPPPGHTYVFNDPAGSSPGDPGARGGNGYVPAPLPHMANPVKPLPIVPPPVPHDSGPAGSATVVGVSPQPHGELYA